MEDLEITVYAYRSVGAAWQISGANYDGLQYVIDLKFITKLQITGTSL